VRCLDVDLAEPGDRPGVDMEDDDGGPRDMVHGRRDLDLRVRVAALRDRQPDELLCRIDPLRGVGPARAELESAGEPHRRLHVLDSTDLDRRHAQVLRGEPAREPRWED
jgi:hypothetical protein